MAFWHWFGRSRDFDDEIESHLRIAVEERIAAGEDPIAARRAAHREFGNVTLTSEAARLVWRGALTEHLLDIWQDVRYAGRVLKRSRGYSTVVIVVLALGIAANVNVFRLVQAGFLRPLPGVANANALAAIVGRGAPDNRAVALSYPDYRYLREHQTTFTGLVASNSQPMSLGLGKNAERVWGEVVSDNYFQVLGIEASRGRVLLPSDDPLAGGEPVAVITDGLWRRVFGADPTVVGKKVRINTRPVTIVGIAEAGFHGSTVGARFDLFLPLTTFMPPERRESSSTRWLIVLGRLAPDISLRMAAAQVDVLAKQLAATERIPSVSRRASVLPFWQSPFGAQTFLLPIVAVLAAMALLVLVIVCTNLANLAFARGLERRGEAAMRLALGASRVRIVRLLLIENLMLAVPAGGLGLLLAVFAPGPNNADIASVAPSQMDLSMDHVVVAVALLVSCASAIFFGFIPALRVAHVPLAGVMKDEGATQRGGRARVRGALVAVQVASAVLLLVGAGLTLRTVSAAQHAEIGFDPTQAVSVAVDLQLNEYDANRGLIFYQQLLDAVRAAPGVESAGLASFAPLRMVEGGFRSVTVDGYAPRPDEDLRLPYNVVSSDYFRTLRIDVLAGREFRSEDVTGGAQTAMVNATFARRFWRTPEQAIGQRLRVGGSEGEWRTVVGVARDIKYLTLTEAPMAYIYLPLTQNYQPDMMIHVRGALTSQELIDRVRTELRTLDPNLPVVEARTLAEQARVGTFLYEAVASGLAGFGVMAIGMAAIGIYGLVSYAVKQRRHEIGIRMALGAQRGHIVRHFVRGGLRLGTIGAVAGLIVALGITRLMAAVLYGVSPTDPVALGGAMGLVLSVTLLASFVPAWRAARANPVAALHHH